MKPMTLIKETDFGTPEVHSQKMVTLEIDGYSVTVPEGTSIMRAAMEAGTKIPKLCATDMLDAFGSCRLCLVEIDAAKHPLRPPRRLQTGQGAVDRHDVVHEHAVNDLVGEEGGRIDRRLLRLRH